MLTLFTIAFMLFSLFLAIEPGAELERLYDPRHDPHHDSRHELTGRDSD